MLAFNHGRRWKTYSKCRPDPKARKMEKSIVRTVVVLKYVDGKCFPNCTGAGVGIQGIAEAERSSLMRNKVDTQTGPERCALHPVPGVCSTRRFFLSLLPLKMCLTAWADDARVSAFRGCLLGESWGTGVSSPGAAGGSERLDAQCGPPALGDQDSSAEATADGLCLLMAHSGWRRQSQMRVLPAWPLSPKEWNQQLSLFWCVYRRSLSILLADWFSVLAASCCVPLQDLKVSYQERGNRIIGGFLVRRKSVYW